MLKQKIDEVFDSPRVKVKISEVIIGGIAKATAYKNIYDYLDTVQGYKDNSALVDDVVVLLADALEKHCNPKPTTFFGKVRKVVVSLAKKIFSR